MEVTPALPPRGLLPPVPRRRPEGPRRPSGRSRSTPSPRWRTTKRGSLPCGRLLRQPATIRTLPLYGCGPPTRRWKATRSPTLPAVPP
eukprot:896649-Alexandrium_andersonii.AAC.1